jgi:chemotaxis protein MotB
MSLASKKRKVTHPITEENSELWLVSYADMMTLLVGFFIILLSVSTMDDRKLKNLSQEISSTKSKAVDTTTGGQGDALLKIDAQDERRLEAMSILASRLNLGSVDEIVMKMEQDKASEELVSQAREALTDTSDQQAIGQPQIEKGEFKNIGRNFELIIPAQTLFETGSASLTSAAEKSLQDVINKIRRVDGLSQIRIEGHTDSSPITGRGASLYADNWALSSARAGAVAALFAKKGIDPKLLMTSGLADTKPLFAEYDARGTPLKDNKARNRRVHIVLVVIKAE